MVNTHLSAIPQNNLITDDINLAVTPELSSIYVLTEYKNRGGRPIDGKVNIDYIFNYIIDDIAGSDVNLHIGRQINFFNDLRATNNSSTFNRIYYTSIDDAISYDTLAALQSLTLDDIMSTLDDVLGISTGMASKTLNLCVTSDILASISSYIDNVANKIFRNLNQLIRVNRDWRIYGPGATISGNYLTDSSKIPEHLTVPPECFIQYKSGYAAGENPYCEPTPVGVEVSNVQPTVSPANIFTVAEHRHAVTFNVDRNKTAVNMTSPPWAKAYEASAYDHCDKDPQPQFGHHYKRWSDVTYFNDWSKVLGPGADGENKGKRTMTMTAGTATATMGVSTTVSYTSAPKYLSTTGSAVDNTHYNLPAYNTYMWQWQSDDTTQL